jgi:hypothetical protein
MIDMDQAIRQLVSGTVYSTEVVNILAVAFPTTIYEPGFLRKLFLASLADQRNPRTWIDQDEAIVAATRYLGFRNTGPRIRKSFKTAIRLLIRNGDLERDGRSIRRT